MTGIDEVLERLVTDPEFRARLASDPAGALAGYMLYDEDLEVLAATLSDDAGAPGVLEQRTSKTTLAGLLAAFEGVPGGGADADRPTVVGSSPNPPEPAHDIFPKIKGVQGDVEPAAGDDLIEEEIGFAYKTISFPTADSDGPDVAANEIVLDDSAGSSEAIEMAPVRVSSYSLSSSADADADSEVAIESVELQNEGLKEETGHFDGRRMTARDLAGDQPEPESAAQFEIQVGTSDLQNAESVRSQAGVTSGEDLEAIADKQEANAAGSDESLAVGGNRTEAGTPKSMPEDGPGTTGD